VRVRARVGGLPSGLWVLWREEGEGEKSRRLCALSSLLFSLDHRSTPALTHSLAINPTTTSTTPLVDPFVLLRSHATKHPDRRGPERPDDGLVLVLLLLLLFHPPARDHEDEEDLDDDHHRARGA